MTEKEKRWRNPENAEVFAKFARIVKRSTAQNYTTALDVVCKAFKVRLFELLELPLEDIENRTEDFIIDNKTWFAPKYLNVLFNSVKTWLFVNRVIKNRKLFREIKFDKTSLKNSALLSESVSTDDMKKMISLSNGEESVVLAFGAFMALRPSIVPQLRVHHIYPSFRKIVVENGVAKLQLKKPTLMIVPRLTDDGAPLEGNKANIDFMVFIPSRFGEKIELNLNARRLGTETELLNENLTRLDNKRDYTWIVKKYLRLIGKEHLSSYRLRNYGDFLLDKIADKDLKEQLMGHKGEISAVYGFRGLSAEKIADFERLYSVVDKFIDENIFGSLSDTDRKIAIAQTGLAQSLGVSPENIAEIMQALDAGKMSLTQFNEAISRAVNDAYQAKLQETVRRYVNDALGVKVAA
jgi:hypothetical protein